MNHLAQIPPRIMTEDQPEAECCPSRSRSSTDRALLKITPRMPPSEEAGAYYRLGALNLLRRAWFLFLADQKKAKVSVARVQFYLQFYPSKN